MKYIDAERLRVEIERRRKICADIAANKRNEEVAEYYRGKEVAYDETSSLITSLLQEQPESGSSEKPNNLLSEKQEQQEVDFEKEYEQWLDLSGIGEAWENGEWSTNDIRRTARHFYELGLNARKED